MIGKKKFFGLPIPITLQDLFNKIYQKDESLYTREETPLNVIYLYGTRAYRGVTIPLIDKIIVEYDSSVGTEIYTAVRDEHGTLLSTHKEMRKEPYEVLVGHSDSDTKFPESVIEHPEFDP